RARIHAPPPRTRQQQCQQRWSGDTLIDDARAPRHLDHLIRAGARDAGGIDGARDGKLVPGDLDTPTGAKELQDTTVAPGKDLRRTAHGQRRPHIERLQWVCRSRIAAHHAPGLKTIITTIVSTSTPRTMPTTVPRNESR